MQHDGAESGAAHPRIRDPHHVLDALPGELHRNRDVAGLRHAGRAARARRCAARARRRPRRRDRARRCARREIVERVEHDGAAAVRQAAPGVADACLITAPSGARLPLSTAIAPTRMDRIVDAPNDLLRRIDFRGGDHFAERAARYRRHVEMQQWPQFAQYRAQAAGVVQVLHVVQARTASDRPGPEPCDRAHRTRRDRPECRVARQPR